MPDIKSTLQSLDREHRLRVIPGESFGRTLDLSQNDYLGLGAHALDFQAEFLDRFPDAAFTSSASRLLSSRQKYHAMYEEMLEVLYGKPALLFNSGYHANVGCTGALSLPSTLFVCDKLIHASVVDGLKINGAEFKRFPHNDMEKLRRIVDKEASAYERIVIVTESIFSMDGDEAPLETLVEIKKKNDNVMLYVDEAHAFGVRGPRGLGIAEEKDLIREIDLLIGTLGKAAASSGAFAICSEDMKSLLVNFARPFIFSTALPPANVAWSILMTEKIIGMQDERRHLADISREFSRRLSLISGKDTGSTSQIIPYLTGNAANALAIASKLKDAGVTALPIRRPTVPPGGERIRFSLSADMETEQFESTFEILQQTQTRLPI